MILIVDDNEIDAKFLERDLKSVGCQKEITIINSGQGAIDLLQDCISRHATGEKCLPDVMFLDLKLGDMNGLEVLKWITTQPPIRRMIVIIHSGIVSSKDVEALYTAGANSFLRKANDTQELRNLIEYYRGHFS